MDSIWWDDAARPYFPQLGGDKETRVLIIGGGMAGLLCAHKLHAAGVDCILVEAGRICGGITKNTTAKITYQHGLIYDKLIRSVGLAEARAYLEANRRALDDFRALCKNIGCGFTQRDSYVYSLTDREKIQRETEALARLGAPAHFAPEPKLPFHVAGAVCVERQAQFNPLQFAFAIAKDLPIYENTKVLELRPGEAVTNRGSIKAESIIVATHFPIINKHGAYFLKLYQHRSYVIALKNAADLGGMYVDEDEKGLSFRNHGDYLLIGGGSHRTGKKGGGWQELRRFARRYYPNSAEAAHWATQDCMSLDGLPYIGQYSSGTKGLYTATGFNKWGMTSSMVAADILCDMVQGKQSPYSAIFDPSRSILRPQLAINAAESLMGLLRPTVPRCPHMGCALHYNRAEHSWDCSCHGSRFTEDGKLIDNPATDDKRK